MKELAYKTALAGIAVFSPIHSMLIVVGILVIADLSTGLAKAYKTGQIITSFGLRRTLTKMLAYQTAVITAFLLEKFLLDGVLPAGKLVASIIGITEFKSILENTEAITGKPVFKSIIDKLNSRESGK